MIKLVSLDRDGTINEDKNYFLGSEPYWRNQVKILEGVFEGIKKLNSLPETEVVICTNQTGIALKGPRFEGLTEERVNEVNKYIIDILAEKGANIRECYVCPFIDFKYLNKVREKGWDYHTEFLRDNDRNSKPNIGMLEKCAESLSCYLSEVEVYSIGDRYSDILFGINGGGKGILVISEKTRELGDEYKVRVLQNKYPNRVFIAENFLDATKYISNGKS